MDEVVTSRKETQYEQEAVLQVREEYLKANEEAIEQSASNLKVDIKRAFEVSRHAQVIPVTIRTNANVRDWK